MGTAASVLSAPEAAQAEALDARADGLEEYVGWPLGSVEQVLDKYEELGTGAPRFDTQTTKEMERARRSERGRENLRIRE